MSEREQRVERVLTVRRIVIPIAEEAAAVRPQRIDEVEARLADAAEHESAARRLTQDLALALQASLLARHAPDFVFDAFVKSRLGADWAGAFGTLAPNIPFDALIARAMPAAA